MPPSPLRQLYRIQQRDADTKFKHWAMHFEWPTILFLLHISIHNFYIISRLCCGNVAWMTNRQLMVNRRENTHTPARKHTSSSGQWYFRVDWMAFLWWIERATMDSLNEMIDFIDMGSERTVSLTVLSMLAEDTVPTHHYTQTHKNT